MNAEVTAAGAEVIGAAAEALQNARATDVAEQNELLAQGDKAGAVAKAQAYKNKVDVELAKGRTTTAMSEQNQVGWLVNAMTFGYNGRAQKALFALMHEVIRLLEEEKVFADQRLTEVQAHQPQPQK
ncbi:MAG TPA: hypothetical protein V6C81_02675 [Planktothrix sp.]|jgi:hypothetical protein